MKYSINDIMLIFDIDGVLHLNEKFNDIKFLNNYNVAFCTGRGYRRAYAVLNKLCNTKNRYIIINNGATIIYNNEKVLETCINKSNIKKLKKIPKVFNMEDIKFINVITSNKKGYQFYDPHDIINYKNSNVYECKQRFTDYTDFIKYCNKNNIVKITIVFKEKIISEPLLKKLNFIKSDDYCACMINKKINKMTGIKQMLKLNKVSIDKCLYFGNDKNDYDVFRNRKIKKIYVYNKEIDDFLEKKCTQMIRFDNLSNFLRKEFENENYNM